MKEWAKELKGATLYTPHCFRKFTETVMKLHGIPDPALRYFLGQKAYLDESYFKPSTNSGISPIMDR